MVLWKYTLREVRSRPGRALLTLASIVIGVAAVVAVIVGKATTEEACRLMYESVAGRAALEIAKEDDGFFDKEIATQIEQVAGVQTAVPMVQEKAVILHKEKRILLLAKGVDLTRSESLANYDLAEGTMFTDRYDILLESGFARSLGLQVNDKVKIPSLKRGLKTLTVVGLLSPKGASGLIDQVGAMFLPLTTAEFLFSKTDAVNVVSVVLKEGAEEKGVAAEIAKLLPPGLAVRSPMARSQLAKETVQSVEVGLQFACILMIGVAVIMIVNTFLMNVGERRRQLAILRAIGTTRRQVVRMLVVEGFMMGIVGTILGALLGLGGAQLLTKAMGQVYSTGMPPLKITMGPFLLAAALGPSISLVAMFVPAFIASRVSPLEGMRFIASEGRSRVTVSYILFSLLVYVITGSSLVACVTGYLPIEGTTYAGVLFTLAFLLLVPIVLGPLARLASFVLYPVLRVEGQIAQRQVLRRRARATLTIGILYVAISSVISMGTMILNNVEDIRSWQAKTLKGDYFVRISAPDLATAMAPSMPESLSTELGEVDGVANVEALSYLQSSIRTGGPDSAPQKVSVFVREFSNQANLPLDIKSGDPAELRQRLVDGQVVMGTVLASRTNTKVGDQITLETGNGPKQFTVAATATAYMAGGMMVYIDRQVAKKVLDVDAVSMFIIRMKPGLAAGAGYDKLRVVCDEGGLMLLEFADLRQRVDTLITGVVASLWGLLALGFVVGGFGIANTLTMNVLEQTRELALLRVVAMTRRQVRKTVLAQAVIIGFIGMALGIVGGVLGAYTGNLCSAKLLGNAVAFTFQPQLLAICFAMGLVVILVSAWLPAERATRLNLLIALQYE